MHHEPHNWHSAGSVDWPLTMLKYEHIFEMKNAGAILSNGTRKLSWFEITKMPIAVLRNRSIVSFIIIF